MPHGTTVYFKHADVDAWRAQLSTFEKLLTDFGAIQETLDLNGSRKFWATVTKGTEAIPDDVTVFSTHNRMATVTCDSIDSLVDGTIHQVELNWARPLRYPAAPSDGMESSRSPDSEPLSITLIHLPAFHCDEVLSGQPSRGVWRLDIEAALDPPMAKWEVESVPRYAYDEVWDYYELMKRIHHEMGFDLTAGSFVENYYEFGESEGNRPGFDSLFRFDRNGPSRLILPYEEKRPFRTELDENGDSELSFDPETGLYRCMVSAGPVR